MLKFGNCSQKDPDMSNLVHISCPFCVVSPRSPWLWGVPTPPKNGGIARARSKVLGVPSRAWRWIISRWWGELSAVMLCLQFPDVSSLSSPVASQCLKASQCISAFKKFCLWVSQKTVSCSWCTTIRGLLTVLVNDPWWGCCWRSRQRSRGRRTLVHDSTANSEKTGLDIHGRTEKVLSSSHDLMTSNDPILADSSWKAEVDAPDVAGQTASHIAAKHGNREA